MDTINDPGIDHVRVGVIQPGACRREVLRTHPDDEHRLVVGSVEDADLTADWEVAPDTGGGISEGSHAAGS
jgi:hypothetical protein